MTGHAKAELAGVELDRHVDRRGKSLTPLLAKQIGVGRAKKVDGVHRAEQPAKGPGQKQRPRPGIDALARDIHEGDLEPVARA